MNLTTNNSNSTPQTLAQKLIARAAGLSHVAVGDVVTCQVDLAMFHDSSGPRRLKPMLDELGAKIWDASKVVLVMDTMCLRKMMTPNVLCRLHAILPKYGSFPM